MKSLINSNHLTLLIALTFCTAIILSGCGLSLAEDITPPPNYRSPTPVDVTEKPVPPEQQVSLSLPDSAANIQNGKLIYDEKCLPCHGELGLGNGPQAGNLPVPVVQIGNPEISRSAKPSDWFKVVSIGNIERFMPGFTSLDDSSRWDVVAYVFTLSSNSEELDLGKGLFTNQCASCHGVLGKGDGEKAATLSTPLSDWTITRQLSYLSGNDIDQLISQGKGEMPAFPELGDAQRWSIISYVRSLGFTHSSTTTEQVSVNEVNKTPSVDSLPGKENASPDNAGSENVVEKGTINIYGEVLNASAGGNLLGNLELSLIAFSGMSPAFTIEGTIQEDGRYEFNDVQYSPDLVYIVRAIVDGVSFNSDIVHGKDIVNRSIELPVEVYESSTDITPLKADRLHVFFDFSQTGLIQVIELFIISNPTDRVIKASSPDQAVINFDLPEGAVNLQFEDSSLGDRYIKTEKGFGDRASILPGLGQHQVLFAYELPYDKKLDLSLIPPIPVDAAVVMLPQDGVKLKSDQMESAGERDVQGMKFLMYNATNALTAGQSLKVQLTGRASSTGTASDQDSILPVAVGGIAFALALIVGGVWFFRNRQLTRSEPDKGSNYETDDQGDDENSETIIDAIVTLDDLYQSGQLPELAYQERRDQLKVRLRELLEKEKGDSSI